MKETAVAKKSLQDCPKVWLSTTHSTSENFLFGKDWRLIEEQNLFIDSDIFIFFVKKNLLVLFFPAI